MKPTAERCAGCTRPILDRFLLSVVDRAWHVACVKCADCDATLADKCFSRDGKLFCRQDFFRRFGTKCGGCSQGISPTDLVRRARGQVFHLACFTCLLCRKQLSTGEELYVLDENRFICKEDYISNSRNLQQGASSSPPVDSPDFEESLEIPAVDPGTPRDTERDSSMERERDVISGGSAANSPSGGVHSAPSTDPHPPGGTAEGCPGGSNDEGATGGTKRRGPRTTIKAKQLETLKAAFAATPKPTRHIREQLAQETGLNMRVIQVWFQNRRSKERRMKQLSALGSRRHFFRNPRRAMRPLRAGIGHDGIMEDGSGPHSAPYSYFSDSSSPNDFGYGPHPGFYEYFPGHPQDLSLYPGTMPIGSAVGANPLDPQNPPNPALQNGGLNLGSDAPYISAATEFLGQRSSPENSSLSLSTSAGDGYGNSSRPADSYNSLANHAPHLSETAVW